MRLRPTEIKAVAALLDQEWDDVNDLAREILRTVNAMRKERKQYAIAVRDGGLTTIYGPYDSTSTARRDVEQNIFASRPNARGGIYVLHPSVDSDMDVV